MQWYIAYRTHAIRSSRFRIRIIFCLETIHPINALHLFHFSFTLFCLVYWLLCSVALPFSIFSVSIFHLFRYEHAQHLNWAVNTEFLLKRSILSKNTDVVVFHFMYIFIFARFYDFKAEKSAHDYLQPFIFQLLFVAFIFLFVSCFLFVFILFGEIKRHHT